MKKVYLSVISCLLTLATCFGQTLYGVQGSFQSSNISVGLPTGATGLFGDFDYKAMFTSSSGFRLGIMADVPITEQLSIRPQLLYSTKGYKIDARPLVSALSGSFGGPAIPVSSLPDSLVTPFRVNYLELPIQAMYGFDAGPGRVVVGAGPYIAYALNGSVNGEAMPFDADTKRFDYGAALSLGYELPTGISISAFYSHGFANQAASSTAAPDPTDPMANPASLSGGGRVTNQSFGITLGYFFGTGN